MHMHVYLVFLLTLNSFQVLCCDHEIPENELTYTDSVVTMRRPRMNY